MLWRVLGGTDEAGVNLQGLVSLTRHVETSSISFFPSEHCAIAKSCADVSRKLQLQEVEEVTRLRNQ